jgi:hypothetical protein
MKKYTIGQETFYLQELPLMDKPSPSGSFSLSRAELDLTEVVEEDDYTVERYIENGVAKVIIRFQKDEDGRGLILMMDEADMERNGFK